MKTHTVFNRTNRVRLEIATAAFVATFGIFMLSRYFLEGQFPRWYHLALSSFLWVFFALVTHKLDFWRFKKVSMAVHTILIADTVFYAVLFCAWRLMFPERGITAAQIWPLGIFIVSELIVFFVYRHLFKKVSYLYVDNIEKPFRDPGMERAAAYAEYEKNRSDLSRMYAATAKMGQSDMRRWILSHKGELSDRVLVIESEDDPLLETAERPDVIVCLQPFNAIRHLNDFLERLNAIVSEHGTIALYGETSGMRNQRILNSYPRYIGNVVVMFDYLWTRVLSKLHGTRQIYTLISRGLHHNYPRVEVLGRIAKAGFDIIGEDECAGRFNVAAVRGRDPRPEKPFYGLFVRLPRRGKDGEKIGVFKLRTMYAYSEYIQDYAYRLNGLEDGGKLKDDFRVNMVGRFCRRCFLDEIPMLLNYFRGDLKFVGVRPLSEHYLSLYSPEMQKLHLSVKPGLFPPLYYEFPKPSTIEQIQECERRYIEKYNCRPRQTDKAYFFGMLKNIIFKRERSH